MHHARFPEQACAFYQQELALHPDFWACRHNLALVLQDLGQWQQAQTEFERALNDCTDPLAQAQIWESLGDLYKKVGQVDIQLKALNAYRCALALAPRTPRILWKVAQQERAQGQLMMAIHTLQSLVYLAPEKRSAWLALAELQMANLQFHTAEASLESALSLTDTGREKALICLQIAHVQIESGHAAQAFATLKRAEVYAPLDGLHLARLSLLPPVYSSLSALEQTRREWEAALQQLVESKKPLKIADPVSEVGALPFYLPYQGFNDCHAMSQLSELFLRFLPADSGLPQPACSGRLRVGIVSHYFHAHSLMQCFGGVFEHLDPERFELGFFSHSPLLEDEITARLRQRADHWEVLPPSLPMQLGQIRQWQPDVLLYTDLGPHLPTWLLAHYRLAPVQWVFPGHPVTSGSAQIDGFISNVWLDSPQAQNHYREKLLRLDILPTYVTRPEVPLQQDIRAKWGLSDRQHLYLCPVSLFKIHPGMDALFAEILARDPQGVILLLDRPQSDLDQLLKIRFQATMGKQAKRIWFLPWLKTYDFFQLLLNAEVYLETFPFGSGTTLFSAFACGIPVVALAPEFARGRFAAMFYQQMGLGELIAQDRTDYVNKALSWASDPDQRAQVQYLIRAKQDWIFRYLPALKGFEQALLAAHHAAGGRSL